MNIRRIFLLIALFFTCYVSAEIVFTSSFEATESPTAVLKNDTIIVDENVAASQITMTDAVNTDNGEVIGTLTMEGATPTDWQAGKTAYVALDKNTGEGKLIKIKSVRQEAGKTITDYTTPNLDEAFEYLSIKVNEQITPRMLKRAKILTAPGVTARMIPRSGSFSPWFPGLSQNAGQFVADHVDMTNQGLSNMIRFDIQNMPIYRSTANGTAEEMRLNGHIAMNNSKVDFDYEFDRRKPLRSLWTLKSDFAFTTELDKRLALSANVNYQADISQSPLGKTLSCGNELNFRDGRRFTANIKGAYWHKGDICLATISIGLGNVTIENRNSQLPSSPIALQLSLILGADMKIKVSSEMAFSQKTQEAIFTGVDLGKDGQKAVVKRYSFDQAAYNNRKTLVNQLLNDRARAVGQRVDNLDVFNTGDVLDRFQNHYRSELTPKWDKSLSGQFEGNAKVYTGVAASVYFLGVNPIVTRTYGGTKLNGTIQGTASTTAGFNGCYQINADAFLGFSAMVGISANYDLDIPIFNWRHTSNAEYTKEYGYALPEMNINLYNKEVCVDTTTEQGTSLEAKTLTKNTVITPNDGKALLQSGMLNLNGHTLTIEGDLIQSGGRLFVNNGTLIVKGDYRIQTPKADGSGYTASNSGILQMIRDNDKVIVHGDFVTDTRNHSSFLTKGVMELKGNFEQKSTCSSCGRDPETSYYASGTHKVILSGIGQQTIKFEDPNVSYSRFNILEITNTLGINFATDVVVGGLFKHNRNPFTLSTSGSVFQDSDGDTYTDEVDDYPEDSTRH